MNADARRRAEDAVAEFFGIKVEHIREAPKWCGDGYDGSCLRGDCEVVQAVDLLLKFAADALAQAGRERDEFRTKYHDAMALLTQWGNLDKAEAIGLAQERAKEIARLTQALAEKERLYGLACDKIASLLNQLAEITMLKDLLADEREELRHAIEKENRRTEEIARLRRWLIATGVPESEIDRGR